MNPLLLQHIKSIQATAQDAFLETFWPTRCAVCDAPGNLLCDECLQNLPYIDLNRACPRCGAPFGSIQCCECNPIMLQSFNLEQFPLDGLISSLVFDQASRRIVSLYKDHHEYRLAPEVIAPLMARYLPPYWGAQAISFIPATTRAFKKRGFDHCEDLAQAVAHSVNLPCIALFERPTSNDQRNLGRKGRVVNMANRFRIKPLAQIPQSVILIDDVCTTGATLYGAAQTLRMQGCNRIYGLTFARV